MSDPLYHLWLYNKWANTTVIDSLKQNQDPVPASCLRLLSHITNAQIIWLNRINGVPSPVGVWDEHILEVCEKNHALFSTGIAQSLDDERKGTMIKITYKNTQNVVFTDTLMDILLHVFNHGTYHRAQIAQEMKRSGMNPPVTDYIVFKRLGH